MRISDWSSDVCSSDLAIRDAGVKGLTIISNNCGAYGFGLWMLLNNGQIAKMISSYFGENKLFEQLYMEGKLELELNTQGTRADGLRAGGAGIPAFYNRTGVCDRHSAVTGKRGSVLVDVGDS